MVGVHGLNVVLVAVGVLPPDHACVIILRLNMAAKTAAQDTQDQLLNRKFATISLVKVCTCLDCFISS